MNILSTKSGDEEALLESVMKVLRGGGLVVFPTDTVYGLLVDATHKAAVSKLLKFKERPAGRAISIFVADMRMLKKYVSVSQPQEQKLSVLLPGPYTAVLPSLGNGQKMLEAENHTLGVRIPAFTLVTDLVAAYGKPLTATSANLSGKSPSHSVSALMNQLSNKKQALIDLVVDGGELPRRKPSTVVDLTQDSIKILRVGDASYPNAQTFLSKSEIETQKIASDVLGDVRARAQDKPIVFILEGDLGVGKTIFVKGIGATLGITNIISPTYVIYYEYPLKSKEMLVHVDLYKVQATDEFKHLGLEKYLQKGNILAIEWGEKSGEMYHLLKKKATIVYIKMSYEDKNSRNIQVTTL
jgi:L-threonylcarbamoyladenylate synthase